MNYDKLLLIFQANILAQNSKMTINRENPDALLMGKMEMQRPASHAGQRLALGDIGNKVSAVTIDGNNKKPAAIKKEIIHPVSKPKLPKSKATSSLKLPEVPEHEQQTVRNMKKLNVFH